MIDIFSIAISHALIGIALLRILQRPELDNEPAFTVSRKRRVDTDAGSSASE